MAFLVSFMSVFAVASDEDTEVENELVTIFNRGFDDGWEITNGATVTGGTVHSIGLGEEPTPTGVNHYVEMVTGGSGQAGYFQITPSGYSTATTEFILEFDVRSDGFITPNNVDFLYCRVNASDTSASILTLCQVRQILQSLVVW